MAEKDGLEGRCPACRSPYDKDRIVGGTASCEILVAENNAEKKQKSQRMKPRPMSAEGRKQLSSLRVIRRNLVYIIGMPMNLADEIVLERKEYFGQYGKVLKVSISRAAGGAIQQSSNGTCSVYITYTKEEEAIRCIQAVHNFVLEGKPLRACFGTTKYCHTWLRNMSCNNPDCLYLHDIGSQEDSFTKDEIISAYTRNRVPQITTCNLQPRSGNVLPPPADEFGNNGAVSSGKTVSKTTATIPISQAKVSLSNGSGRCASLPAAASWGMRVSNSRAVATTANLGSSSGGKPKSETANVPSIPATGTILSSASHADLGKGIYSVDDSPVLTVEDESRNLEPFKPSIVRELQAIVSDVSSDMLDDCQGTSGICLSTPSRIHDKDKEAMVSTEIMDSLNLDWNSCNSSADNVSHGLLAVNGNVQTICSGMSSLSVNNYSKDTPSNLNKHQSMVNNAPINVLPLTGDTCLQQLDLDHATECSTSYQFNDGSVLYKHTGVLRESQDQNLVPRKDALRPSGSSVGDFPLDALEEKLRPSDDMARPSYTTYSHKALVDDFSSHQPTVSGTTGPLLFYSDPWTEDAQIGGCTNTPVGRHPVVSRGEEEVRVSRAQLGKVLDHSNIAGIEQVKHVEKLKADIAGNKTFGVDTGEDGIISNILSMDFDAWDDSLTSPHKLAKLLNETNKQNGLLNVSGLQNKQSNSQSRFSFARHGNGNQVSQLDNSYDDTGYSQKSCLTEQSRGCGFQNAFTARNVDDSYNLFGHRSVVSSEKVTVSRPQMAVPPGFSHRSRTPPGFCSNDRLEQASDSSFSGDQFFGNNSSLRNQFLVQQRGNNGSTYDVEFIDPAILAVGKGRPSFGVNNSGLDSRSTFPSALGSSEDELRLQLLMQQHIATHQNLRISDQSGDRVFPPGVAHITSGFPFQTQDSNPSLFSQLSFQPERNSRILNSQWSSWGNVQSSSNMGIPEVFRNDSFGINKYLSGNDEMTFRIPSSGNLYNGAFGM
ncbi:hypothetical protein QJS10_CPB20g00359 [Acorus calamus]|uniref:RRM domain-containing protein n=1 Tax=Acorus calamus TaxID=4465 RepID=A0AAV9C966_ACOCL|nr:hypothetical protein QJS10_CPB20g00359 [Acorus calamus]